MAVLMLQSWDSKSPVRARHFAGCQTLHACIVRKWVRKYINGDVCQVLHTHIYSFLYVMFSCLAFILKSNFPQLIFTISESKLWWCMLPGKHPDDDACAHRWSDCEGKGEGQLMTGTMVMRSWCIHGHSSLHSGLLMRHPDTLMRSVWLFILLMCCSLLPP